MELSTNIPKPRAKPPRVNKYKVKFEKSSWFHFWKSSDSDFHYQSNDTVYCYAAVFAPTELDKKIIHQWQIFNERADGWQTTDNLSYKIRGGRDGGYRRYTYKKNMQEGDWRVNVITKEGLLLGRIGFMLFNADSLSVQLKTMYKY